MKRCVPAIGQRTTMNQKAPNQGVFATQNAGFA
jgi:hypothetical protein